MTSVSDLNQTNQNDDVKCAIVEIVSKLFKAGKKSDVTTILENTQKRLETIMERKL